MSKLAGKVAVVTGASKGIGAAIAVALAAEGASVVVNYASSQAGADAVVARITQAGGQAIAVKADISNAAQAQALVDAAVQRFGRLDVLVNNSGVYGFAPLEDITEADFRRHFDINVLGLLLTTQAAAKHLGEGGSVINIGSVVTRITPPGSAVYTATKGAVDAITGVPSGVAGRRPVQKLARDRSPPRGYRSPTTISRVARRFGDSDRSKPATSAMPPTRMRSSKRVIAIL